MHLQHPRCRRARRLAASSLALVLVTAAAAASVQAAGPTPWDQAVPAQFVALAEPHHATQLEAVVYDEGGAGTFADVGDTSSNVRYAALAYDTDDSFLYAIVTGVPDPGLPTVPAGLGRGSLIRIGQGGVIAAVAQIPDVPGQIDAADATAGAYDSETHQYLVWRDSRGDTTNLYAVDTATGAPTLVCALSRRPGAGDLTYQGRFLWGLARAGTGVTLVRVAPRAKDGACRVRRVPVPGFSLPQSRGGPFGAAWTLGNGDLEFSQRSGMLIQLQAPTTGAPSGVIARGGPPSRAGDGAAIAGAQVGLAVTQVPGALRPTGAASWAISVTNQGPATTENWVMSDTLPARVSFTSATYTDGTPAACASSAQANSTTVVTCQGGALPAHATATLTFAARAPAAISCVTNAVQVIAASQRGTEAAGATSTGAPLCRSSRPAAGDGLVVTKTSAPASGTQVSTGQIVTYTLTFQNTGGATATVNYTDFAGDVLDDATVTTQPSADDPSWTVGAIGPGGLFSIQGTVAAGNTVTVTYSVQVLPDGQRGNGLLVNYLTPSSQSPPPECLPASRLCTRNPTAGAPDLIVTKTADPSSGHQVVSGQTIGYTLTFENIGLGPASVSYTDHAAGVLDDAAVTSQPRADDHTWTVGAIGSDGSFPITGTLAAGATVRVTYAVKVLPQDELGNGVLDNFLTPSGLPPPSECLPQNPLCTRHLTPRTPDLQVVKSATPASNTVVKPGQVIAYTLTFRNAGLGAAKVAYTDDARDVIDDVAVTAQPRASDASWKVGKLGPAGTFSITGSVAAVSSVSVTYRVKVLPNDTTHDRFLVNFLTPTGTPPPSSCTTTNPLCTRHVSPAETVPLPQTGEGRGTGGITVPVVGTLPETGLNVGIAVLAALALLAGGLVARRRRATRPEN